MTQTAPDPEKEDLFERYRALVSREVDGPWQVARSDDVRHVLKQHEVFSSKVAPLGVRAADRPPSMLFGDGAVHMRLHGAPSTLPVELRAAA